MYRDVPRLSAEEEISLVGSWQEDGDTLAHDRLVTASMRLVFSMARKLRNYPVSFSDMVAEGTVGLLVAIDRFDAEKGARLSTYASYWIRAYMFRAVIREWCGGRTGLGRRRSDTFFKLRRTIASKFTQAGYGQLDLDELAGKLGVTVEEAQQMLDDLRTWTVPIDASEDEELSMHERVACDEASPEEKVTRCHDNQVLQGRLDEALASLTQREELVLRERLMTDDPSSLNEIGQRLGVTRERVRQIQQIASAKLRESLQAAA